MKTDFTPTIKGKETYMYPSLKFSRIGGKRVICGSPHAGDNEAGQIIIVNPDDVIDL